MIGSRPGWYRDRHESVAVVCQVFLGYGLQPASGFGLVARTLPRKRWLLSWSSRRLPQV